MNETAKPFTCSATGCEMAFTNEDHLNIHERKHDMALHLGIDSPNSNADQTPTPTRFIRNCEEVGLFQDLQNVNPFDETFRKATELAKSGSLHLPEPCTADDSLHTPHIFPHIEDENLKKFTNDNFSITTINDDMLRINKDVEILNSDHSSSTINSTNESCNCTIEETIKSKLQEALKGRMKTDKEIIDAQNNISTVKLEKLDQQKKQLLSDLRGFSSVRQIKMKSICTNKNKSSQQSQLDRQREMNRAAQVRSRQKKKQLLHRLADELMLLRSETKELSKENQKLKNEVVWLKTMLLYHKDCSVSQDSRILDEVNLLSKATQDELEKKMKKYPIPKKVVPIRPNTVNLVALTPVSTPLIVQVTPQMNPALANGVTTFTPLITQSELSTTTSMVSKVIKLEPSPKLVIDLTQNCGKISKSKDKLKCRKNGKNLNLQINSGVLLNKLQKGKCIKSDVSN